MEYHLPVPRVTYRLLWYFLGTNRNTEVCIRPAECRSTLFPVYLVAFIYRSIGNTVAPGLYQATHYTQILIGTKALYSFTDWR